MQKIVIGIEGMMCGMCESHVNDAIRKVCEVKRVESSHDKKKSRNRLFRRTEQPVF